MSSRCRACRSCAAPAPLLLSAADFNRRTSVARFDYYRCKACDLVFLDPVPPDLNRYYGENYHMIPESLEALERSAEAHERFKIDLLRSVTPSGRIVEVGPGAGGFAWLARKAGYDIQVIDMNERACAFISSLGIPAVLARDEIAALHAQAPADAIVMWQVLEHLPDPFRLLEAAARKLKPNGALIVATPNPGALQFKLFRTWWTHLDAPRHVTLIPAAVLDRRARAYGLRPLWRTMTDPGSAFWNRFGWEHSLRNMLGSGFSPKRLERLAHWIARIAAPLERRFELGTAYVAAFSAPAR